MSKRTLSLPTTDDSATANVTPAPDAAPAAAADAASTTATGARTPPPAPTWSDDDEAAYQAMIARRKSAKGKRAVTTRARIADDAVLIVGPAAVTGKSVYSTIKTVVAAAGDNGITRADLITKLRTAEFASTQAKPDDAAWLKGWVSGALRAAVLATKPAA